MGEVVAGRPTSILELALWLNRPRKKEIAVLSGGRIAHLATAHERANTTIFLMQRQHEVALAGTFIIARTQYLRRDRMRNRDRRGVSRKNQTFLQHKSTTGQSIAPVLGTSPFESEGSCGRSHYRSTPRPV